MNVQYRAVDIVLADQFTAIAKSNDAGILLVAAAPPSPATFSETLFTTAGGTGFAVETAGPIVECVLTKLYVTLPYPLVGAAPYFVVVVDKAAALVNGDRSILPTPVMTTPGQTYLLEPPGGILFTAGIRVALSSTPVLYTSVLEECSVSGWTY